MHPLTMRRTLLLALTLLLAGCATAPLQTPTPETGPAPVPQPSRSGSLVGLTVPQLVGTFGTPALQIREGSSVKLQFRGPSCVLDAYLYPSGSGGTLKVTHADARLPSGTDTDQAACILALRKRSS